MKNATPETIAEWMAGRLEEDKHGRLYQSDAIAELILARVSRG